MNKVFTTATITAAAIATLVSSGASALEACEDGRCVPEYVPPAEFDQAVDDDLYNMFHMAPDICEKAREMDADGTSSNDIIDTAVDVFTEEGLITTPEGGYYVRGIVRGCLS